MPVYIDLEAGNRMLREVYGVETQREMAATLKAGEDAMARARAANPEMYAAIDAANRERAESYRALMASAGVTAAVAELAALDPEARLAAMRAFCRGCGSDDPGCYCERDE